MRAEIGKAIDAKVRTLRDRQRILNSELDSFMQQEQRALQSRREAVELDIASVSSYCDSAEGVLNSTGVSNETELVEMQKQCTEHLEKIRRIPTAAPPVARRVTYVPQHADQLQASIDRFGQLQFSLPASAQPQTRSDPDVTMSDVANPDIFFDLPHYVDTADAGTIRHDQPFQSPRLDLVSSTSSAGLFPPIRQETPPVPRPEETRVASTGSPEVFFPPLTQQHARDTTHVPRRFRDYMYEMDTSTDDARDIVDAMRREVLGTRTRAGALFNYERSREDRAAGFMVGAGDGVSDAVLSRPVRYSINWDIDSERGSQDDNDPRDVNPADHSNSGQIVEPDEMDHDAFDTTPATITPEDDLHATMSRGRTFVQPSGARSAAVELPVVNNQSMSFNIAVDTADGARRRRRYDRDPAAVSRVASIYQAKGRVDPICSMQGSAACRFKWPRGVAVSPINDFVIIADSNNDRVQVFDNNGRFVSMFGSSGADDGEFDRPSGTAVSSSGHIIVSDSNNHRVQVFDRHGQFSHKFGSEGTGDGQLSNPWGVAVDPSGFIYVCDKGNDRVQVYQQDGTFVRIIGRNGSERGRFGRPQYVAVGRNNVVVVSDSGNHRVQTFSATGELLRSFGIEGSAAGMLRNPKGVGVDKDGFVVVADSGNNRVQVFREDGQFVCTFGSWGSRAGCFRGLEGIAITSSHKIVVGDRENHRVQKF